MIDMRTLFDKLHTTSAREHPMHVEPYHLEDLKFAYCCHVYYRWHTHRRKPIHAMSTITSEQIEAERPQVHILNLEVSNNAVELALLASLLPTDSIAIAASKIKGGVSKILTRQIGEHTKKLATGYFAATAGPRASDELYKYLDRQSHRHGYDKRADPPVYVRTWPNGTHDIQRLQANHSRSMVRWHLVLATWNRRGTFSKRAAAAIVDRWEELSGDLRFLFHKVSFLPDHVHLAVRTHPAVVPANLVLKFLNSSQELMKDRFDDLLIRTGNPRVWKPSAYIGTYGDLANTQVQAYLKDWRSGNAIA